MDLREACMHKKAVRLGLMPPLTGLVGIYGSEIVHAAQVACQEVNEEGGVLGRPLELIIEDDGSLPESAVAAAKKLVDQHHCTAIIGNLLSNSRIAVAYQIAEPRKIPLLNFSFYEGSILSRYFFHFAALPNQQIDQMIPYMAKKFGSKMFFAGNNYEWPRGSIDAGKKALMQCGGEVVGEEYCPIGVESEIIENLLDQVEEANPDVFVPYFAGADQVMLLTRFTERGLKKKMAVVMGHYDEMMASQLTPEIREGFYSSNTYFMTVDSPENRDYLQRLAKLPDVNGIWPNGNGILTNFGEGAYVCVKAFAKAVNQAGSLDAEDLVEELKNIELLAPQGSLQMNPEHHHAKVNTYLSQCDAEGIFNIVEKFGAITPVIPERYSHQRINNQTTMEDDIRLQARILEQMSDAVFLISSHDGSLVYTNAGAENLYGYYPGEMIGLPVAALNDPANNDPQNTADELISILSTKGEWEGEIRNIKKDGTSIWCSATVSTFTHPVYGEVWLSVQRDITRHKQSEELLSASAEKLRLINSRVPGIVYQFKIGSDGRQSLPYVSPVIEKYLGISAADAMADVSKWFALTHPEDLPGLESSIIESMQNMTLWKWEGRFIPEGGEMIWVRGTSTPVRLEDGSTLWDGIFVDISEQMKVQEALFESELWMKRIYNSLDEAVLVVSIDRKILNVNLAAQRIFGYSADEIYKNSTALFHVDNEHFEKFGELIQQAFSKGETANFEFESKRKNGEVFPTEHTVSFLKNSDGKFLGIVSVIRDISVRKQNEVELVKHRAHLEELVREGSQELYEREQQLKDAQRIAHMGNYEWNLKSNELHWSDTAFALFGLEPGSVEPTAEFFMAQIHPDDVVSVSKIMNDALSRTYVLNAEKRVTLPALDYRIVLPDGALRWLRAEAAAEVNEEGYPVHIHGTVQDVSTHKLAEQEIILAKVEAERANSAKSEFLSSMSHELRTPMNAILGFAQMMKLDEDKLEPVQLENVNEILDAGHHLLELINEVLDLSKIDSGELDIDMRAVDVNDVIESSKKLIQNQVALRKIQLTDNISNSDFVVKADAMRFKQVMLNILSNAVKYNRENGKITIDGEVIGKHRLCISVTDTGNGLTETDLEKLFKPFQRLNVVDNVEGTGIGLVITKRLVELMGGSVGIESEPGKGSRFWVELELSTV